jgi:osmotically-inducible protein OsmY
MKTDALIKQDVLDELVFQPNVDETQIGVLVDEGVVTLTGIVDSYSKKYAARKAVSKVKGVRAIAEDLVVKHGDELKNTDQEIAKLVANFLQWNTAVPEKSIIIEVRNGFVYLTGEVDWWYQKQGAKESIKDLIGVKGVINDIVVKPIVKPEEVKQKITQAFKRLVDLDAENIRIDIIENRVRLSGKVNSITEKEEAYRTACHAPGVSEVKNEIEVVN